jgi:hypothetical protein
LCFFLVLVLQGTQYPAGACAYVHVPDPTGTNVSLPICAIVAGISFGNWTNPNLKNSLGQPLILATDFDFCNPDCGKNLHSKHFA